ncbi:GyrI-like domain-containing protein [Chryseobacterium oryzae]|uniref:GyrI-like domain-containing protein n=1 Tax=Chryseobacterium oryzae TaxID=2929799 RepID=A0ABY4BER5_9FLAO|nr:GyrI-like domain-containing protein [Chryseobacterium oryzae]UOE37560.1 GyrI-like domain-containing protein [Chryseobacterium oryzae]
MDNKQSYNDYYKASEQPEIVEIPKASYISIAGNGSPGTDIFYEKKKAIVEFVKALQNQFKNTENAFSETIVEIFYWFDEDKVGYVDIGNFYTTVDLSLLNYRIAIRVPEFVTNENITNIAAQKPHIPFANMFERFVYTAGKCVQLLHKGPFAGELETLPILQKFATKNGLKKSGMHQEIHLINFEKGENQAYLETILRDAVTEM